MTKPVQIQPVVWICTKPLDGKPFDEPFITTNEAYVKLHKNYDWQPLVPQAALLQVRSLLEAKAKEWRDEAQREYDAGNELGKMGSRESAMRVNARSRTRANLADQLLSLAATLGNQGK